jgi:hypothetical protein
MIFNIQRKSEGKCKVQTVMRSFGKLPIVIKQDLGQQQDEVAHFQE